MKKLLLLFVAIVVLAQINAQIFVDAMAVGSNNGTSWANAYNDLGNAIYNSSAGDTLWVKEGNYNPSFDSTGAVPSNATQRTFWLKNGVVVYGGFTGTETSLSQRDPVNHKATLTGDFGSSIFSQHVITVYSNIDSTAVMDGFNVTNGVAASGSPVEHGGGLLLFGDAWFYNMNFISNTGYQHGGAVYSNFSNSTFVNCRFAYNIASSFDGGAVNFNNSDVELYNCLFQSNTAARFGAAATSVLSDVKFQNCTFFGNTAPHNVFQHSLSGTLRIYNSVFDNNTASSPIGSSSTIDFKDGVVPNAGWTTYCPTCLVGTPTFINVGIDNYGLTSTSLGVDENLTGTYINPYTDIIGNTRLVGTSMDMGAYEYQGNAGISENSNEIRLLVFPNPVSAELSIKTDEKIEHVTIVNLMGEVIQQEVKNTFSVENLSSGMYVLQIRTEKGMGTVRFIKE